MAHTNELEEEIRKAEEALYHKPKAIKDEPPIAVSDLVGEAGVEQVKVVNVPLEESAEEVTIQLEAANQPEPEKPTEPEPNWKERFTNYKAATDATLHGQRQEIVYLRDQNEVLQERVDNLFIELAARNKKDAFEGVFTEDEVNMIGEEAINTFKKAALAAAKQESEPLRQELEREKKLRKKAEQEKQERARAENDNAFLTRLARIVPDYAKIDIDPKFHAYMKGPDSASGFPREYIFKKAHASGDVQRVADFFKEFKAVSNPLESRITPAKEGMAGTPPQKPKRLVLNQKVIEKFYDDVVRGKYKGREKEQLEIERLIDKHLKNLALQRRA